VSTTDNLFYDESAPRFFSVDDGCGPVLSVEHSEAEVVLRFGLGSLRITCYRGPLVRMTYSRREEPDLLPSYAVLSEALVPVPVALQEGDGAYHLTADGVTLTVQQDSGALCVRDSAGRLRMADREHGFLRCETAVGLVRELDESVRSYGLGEKTGFLEKRGRVYHMWNSDEPQHHPARDPLYQSVPVLITEGPQAASALFVDAPGSSWFDIDSGREGVYSVSVEADTLDSYLMLGERTAEVVALYGKLTGQMPLPPLWSLGYQQSRYSYETEAEVREIARTFREKKIPCDVLHFDIHYMDGYRVFTWDPLRFPRPAQLLSELLQDGFRVVTIIDPGVKADPGYAVYKSGMEGNHFCHRTDGTVYVGRVWPGEACYPNFFSPRSRDWWAEQHRPLFNAGVSGIWNDMNEPSDFTGDFFHRSSFTPPQDVVAERDGIIRPLSELHNLYGVGMNMATRRAFEQYRPGVRPFVLTRAGYAGVQRYAAVWTGDNHSYWEHMAASIPMLLNLGLSGVAFTGADVGGFQHNATAELFARWIAYGAFTPFFRGHTANDTQRHEPWSFGREVEEIARKMISVRYSLLPYIYSEFARSRRDGLPVMRPLFLDYPDDPRLCNLNDQYLFGTSLLVAPVLQPGKVTREVYLPEGVWYDFWTGTRHDGPADIVARAPLSVIPLFVAGGSVIPRTRPADHTKSAAWNPLELYVYPSRGSAGAGTSFTLHEDDGFSTAWTEGSYRSTDITLRTDEEGHTLELLVTHDGFDPGRTSLSVILPPGRDPGAYRARGMPGTEVSGGTFEKRENEWVAEIALVPGTNSLTARWK